MRCTRHSGFERQVLYERIDALHKLRVQPDNGRIVKLLLVVIHPQRQLTDPLLSENGYSYTCCPGNSQSPVIVVRVCMKGFDYHPYYNIFGR